MVDHDQHAAAFGFLLELAPKARAPHASGQYRGLRRFFFGMTRLVIADVLELLGHAACEFLAVVRALRASTGEVLLHLGHDLVAHVFLQVLVLPDVLDRFFDVAKGIVDGVVRVGSPFF